jgi:alkaline phosphatase D
MTRPAAVLRAIVAACLFGVACTPALIPPAPGAAATPAIPVQARLQSGPMVGYSDMRQVILWAQTTDSAIVHFVYWDTAAPGTRHRTVAQATRSRDAYTTRQIAGPLEPGRGYAFEVWVNGERMDVAHPLRFQTQHLWQWRTDPPAFRIALASCFYVNETEYDRPGQPYGGDYQILSALARSRPDAMIWLGDNTYYREVDWHTREGMLRRFTHTRSLPELQPLLGTTHHYAIWDDHDFGPDNSDRSWAHKESALDVFRLFWGNPTYGVGGRPGVTTYFQWGDVDFFLLDDRYNRAPNDRITGERTILGAEQFEWLIDALRSSRAPFRIVAMGGQILNPVAEHETYSNVAPEERRRLIETITAEKIPGVFFVSGDRHASDLTRIERPGTYPLYDLTVSPLTAGVAAGAVPNPGTVPGTLITQRNYALLDFSGPRTDRVMQITLHDAAGTELWTRAIRASELR